MVHATPDEDTVQTISYQAKRHHEGAGFSRTTLLWNIHKVSRMVGECMETGIYDGSSPTEYLGIMCSTHWPPFWCGDQGFVICTCTWGSQRRPAIRTVHAVQRASPHFERKETIKQKFSFGWSHIFCPRTLLCPAVVRVRFQRCFLSTRMLVSNALEGPAGDSAQLWSKYPHERE